MFTPSRLTFARKRRGLTKTDLAKAVGVTQQAISDFENNRYIPADETLLKLSITLDFPLAFFSQQEELMCPSTHTASFRALTKMTASKRDAALHAGGLAFLLNEWIEKHFNLPSTDLIDLRDETPESAAIALRQHWMIGERPIKNMIHLLESKGIRVYSLEEDTLDVDAFSCWQNGIPFIFLNTMKSSERSRFDAAHELGHLVLHRHGSPLGLEKDANKFASAFLMPEGSVRAACPPMPTLSQLIKLKHQWIVSVAALVYRLHDLNLLNDWQHRMLVSELSSKGLRISEPEPAQRETSLIFAKIFAALREDSISKKSIAKDLIISKKEIEKLVFGLTMVGITGGNSGNAKSSKAILTIIE